MQQSLFGSLALSSPVASDVASQTNLEQLLFEDAVFTVLDLETTGLNAKKNAITEVTAIQFRNGEEVGKYSTLVKPTETIPEEVELLTGITNDMVKNAPALVMVLSELAGFVGESPIIVGHNIQFDINFLREKLSQNGLNAFVDHFDLNRAICTRAIAVKALPGLPSYEGIVVATSVGVHNPNPHRAEADVRMSAGILFEIFKRVQAKEPAIKTVADFIAWQGSLG
jgi:DNA polymerase III epsilon subunit family exonuclease